MTSKSAVFKSDVEISGNSILEFSGTSSKLGINMTPSNTLDVSGNVGLIGSLTIDQRSDDSGLIINRSGADVDITSSSGSNNLVLSVGNTSKDMIFETGESERVRIDNVGNVGIGTDSPNASYKLDVDGSVNIVNNLDVSGGVNIHNNLVLSGDLTVNGNDINMGNGATIVNTTGDRLVVTEAVVELAGDVSINSNLDIVGDINSVVNIDGTGDLTMDTITMTGFSVDADGDVITKSIDNTDGGITNAGAISGATSIDGDGDLTMGTITMTGFSVDADGDVITKSIDNTDGGITNAGAISGATSIDGTGDLTMNTITMTGFEVDADGDVVTKSINNSNGGITNAGAISGITTTNSNIKITDVSGRRIELGHASNMAHHLNYYSGSTSNSFFINYYSGEDITIFNSNATDTNNLKVGGKLEVTHAADIDGSLNVGTNTLIVDSTNNNVGIGTSVDADYKLKVDGSSNIIGVLKLGTIDNLQNYVQDISADLDNLSQNQLVDTNNSDTTLTLLDNSMSFAVGGTERLNVSSSSMYVGSTRIQVGPDSNRALYENDGITVRDHLQIYCDNSNINQSYIDTNDGPLYFTTNNKADMNMVIYSGGDVSFANDVFVDESLTVGKNLTVDDGEVTFIDGSTVPSSNGVEVLSLSTASWDNSNNIVSGYGPKLVFKTTRGHDSDDYVGHTKSAYIKGYINQVGTSGADYHSMDLDVYGDNGSLHKGITIQSVIGNGGSNVTYYGAKTFIHGNSDISGNLTVGGGLTVEGDISGTADRSDAVLTNNFTDDTNNKYVGLFNGPGTDSNYQTLGTVNGLIYNPDSGKIFFKIIGVPNAATNIDICGGGFTVDIDTLYVNHNDHNVGIGTSSPDQSYKLDVNGDTRIDDCCIKTDGNYFYIVHNDLAGNHSTDYIIRQANDGSTAINAKSGKSLSFNIGNNGKMKIDSAGNVGIGASYSPNSSYKLDVNGSARIVNNLDVDGNLTVTGTITGTASQSDDVLTGSVTTSTNNDHYVGLFSAQGTGSNYQTISTDSQLVYNPNLNKLRLDRIYSGGTLYIQNGGLTIESGDLDVGGSAKIGSYDNNSGNDHDLVLVTDGTGTGVDADADQFVIMDNESSNTMSLKFGVNTSNQYGYIQCTRQNDNQKTLKLNDLGGTVETGGNLKVGGTLYDSNDNEITGGSTFFTEDSTGTTISYTGTVQATNFVATSDERKKKNIQALESPLEKIMKLQGRNYTWNDSCADGLVGKKSSGFIAQEVEKVIPEVVMTRPPVDKDILEKNKDTTGDDGDDDKKEIPELKGIDYNGLVPYLVECIKELKTELDINREELKTTREILKANNMELYENKREISALNEKLQKSHIIKMK